MIPHLFLEDPTPEDTEDEEECSLEEARPKGNRGPRNRPSIYEKMLAVREADRLIDSGMTSGVEKKVMETFPKLFASHSNGKFHMKSGMLGRWLTQAKEQQWRMIPWDRMAAADRNMKELPDWVRVPMGQPPRILEKFKEGRNIPKPVMTRLLEMVSKSSCGVDRITSGPMSPAVLKREAEELLEVYAKTQKEEAERTGMDVPEAKTTITTRWCKRLLQVYGFKEKTPNTYGAYLPYEDLRMEKSRKTFNFSRTAMFARVWPYCEYTFLEQTLDKCM